MIHKSISFVSRVFSHSKIILNKHPSCLSLQSLLSKVTFLLFDLYSIQNWRFRKSATSVVSFLITSSLEEFGPNYKCTSSNSSAYLKLKISSNHCPSMIHCIVCKDFNSFLIYLPFRCCTSSLLYSIPLIVQSDGVESLVF